MVSAKDILVKPIKSNIANDFVKKYHYSGKVVQNSQLHFGCFLNGVLGGVMSFGPSLDKKKIQSLVKNTGWNDFLELNRMAFSDILPRNSESRCISIAIKLIKKYYPHIKWIISFADGQQCGDGTIYRASGFYLTGLSSGAMWILPEYLAKLNNGNVAHRLKIQDKCSEISKYVLSKTNGKNLTMNGYVNKFGGKLLDGYNLRYIYFIDKSKEKDLTVPILPYSTIDKYGARMYKGQKLHYNKNANAVVNSESENQLTNGGASPTQPLHLKEVANG